MNRVEYKLDVFPLFEKDAHACLRNIVSFSRFPHKTMFKSFSRAIRHICSTTLRGWDVPNLAEAATSIKSDFAKLGIVYPA